MKLEFKVRTHRKSSDYGMILIPSRVSTDEIAERQTLRCVFKDPSLTDRVGRNAGKRLSNFWSRGVDTIENWGEGEEGSKVV